jgi:hypothetical protein
MSASSALSRGHTKLVLQELSVDDSEPIDARLVKLGGQSEALNRVVVINQLHKFQASELDHKGRNKVLGVLGSLVKRRKFVFHSFSPLYI